MKIYTVSELNLEARETILVAFEYPISVKGEITDFRSSKGHQYFRLRDKSGGYTVECVIWKNTYSNIDISKYVDMQVIVTAKVDFYAGFGKFQLNVSEVSEFGDGFLKKEIEKLKARLSKEGLFDFKKEVPLFPQNIGVLTAHDSHALKDVCSKLAERYPLAKVYVYPSTVQGLSAPTNLIKMLKQINQDNIVDVVLIVRGGGSLQDLMAFNDETLIREISKSKIPTITGIGHKPDVTLADYASDSAQETPTAAAVRAVPDISILRQDLYQIEVAINKAQQKRLIYFTDKINNVASLLKVNAPNRKVRAYYKDFTINLQLLRKLVVEVLKKYQLSLDTKYLQKKQVLQMMNNKNASTMKNIKNDTKAMEKNILNKLNQFEELLKLKDQQVNQLNPKNILNKGYAIVRDKEYKIIKDSNDAKNNIELKIEMMDGYIDVYRKEKKT